MTYNVALKVVEAGSHPLIKRAALGKIVKAVVTIAGEQISVTATDATLGTFRLAGKMRPAGSGGGTADNADGADEAGGGLRFDLHKPHRNYVHWGFADRAGWPEKAGKKTINGLLFVNEKKVEWIPKGREWTGIQNALSAGGKYFNPDVRPGATLRLEIRDIHGKVRNPALAGTLVYR